VKKPREGKPRRTTNRGEALPASYDLFKKLVAMLNEVMAEKLRCDFVRVPKIGEDKTFGSPLVTCFPTKWKGRQLYWSTVTRDGKTRARYLAAARGVCHGERYFYLLEIEPPKRDIEKEREARHPGRKPRGPRTYTMLLIGDSEQNFADITAENLREVLALCAKNEGSWLKKGELKDFARKKFKHASRLEKVFVARIIEYLLEVNLLILEEREVKELLRSLRSVEASKLSQTEETLQGDAQSHQTGEVVERATSSKHSESSQPLEIGDTSQSDQPIVIDILSEPVEPFVDGRITPEYSLLPDSMRLSRGDVRDNLD
jgi:hypothetical protein